MAKQTGYRGSVKGEAGRTAGERNVVAASKGKKVVPPSDKFRAEDEKDLLVDEQAADGQPVGHAAAPGLADSTTFTAMMAGAAAAAGGAGAEKSEEAADAGGGGIGVLPIILGVAAIGGGVAAAGGGGSGGSSGGGSQPKSNAAPVVANAIADQTSAEDAAWSFVVPSNAFSDPDGNVLTLTATLADGAALPSWLTFNAATRTFSGTPPRDYNGVLELKVAASDGTLSVSDVFKLTVTPLNDAPVVTSAAAAAQGSVSEAGHTDDGAAVAGVASATGTLTSSDVDAGATKAWSVVGAADAAYGQFAVNAQTGVWTYTLDNTLAATQALKEGETKTLTYTVRVTDDQGAYADQAVTITVNGTNDKPVVTNAATAAQGSVSEAGHLDDGTVVDGIASATGTLTSSDVDANATKAWSVVGTSDATYGQFAVNAETGVWTYTLDNTLAATQALKEGETKTLTYTVRVTDDQGAYADQAVTVTVAGTNDKPVITSSVQTGAVNEDGTLSVTGTVTSSDVDLGATKAFSGDKVGTYGAFTVNAATGVWKYDLSNTSEVVQVLDQGETKTETFTVTVTDDKGATATQDVTVTITGTNDLPQVVAAQSDLSVSFGEAGPTALVPSSQFIRVAGSDRDGGVVTYTIPTETQFATLTRGPDGTGFTYTPKDLNYHGTEVITVRLNDPQGDGKFTDYQVSVTVTPNLAENLVIDNGLNPLTLDADGSGYTRGDNFAFLDNSALPTNVEIDNFRSGDTIRVSSAASNYSFAVTESGDLEITYTDTTSGAPNRILLKGVAVNAGFIEDETTAELQLGLGNFFISETGGSPGGSNAGGGSLDVDNDGNIQTFAPFTAAGGNVAFTDDATVSNRSVIENFSQGDTITVLNGVAGTYSFARDDNAGNDVVITYNSGTAINEIVLVGVAANSTAIIDSVDDVEALVGAGFFSFANSSGGGFNPSAQPLSIDNAAGTNTLDAGAGSRLFVDDAGVRTDVIIQNFTADDRISTNTLLEKYSFAISEDDADDLVITFNNNGVPNQIVLDEILLGKDVFIDGYQSARDAVGFDIFTFG